jgi:hypothetical protein
MGGPLGSQKTGRGVRLRRWGGPGEPDRPSRPLGKAESGADAVGFVVLRARIAEAPGAGRRAGAGDIAARTTAAVGAACTGTVPSRRAQASSVESCESFTVQLELDLGTLHELLPGAAAPSLWMLAGLRTP